jgi:hypothetical protein
MDGITVVVANDMRTPAAVAEATGALATELVADEDEVVWVDRAGLEPSLDGVIYLRGPADGGRGHLYALGLRHATRDVVAFTDSTTILVPGWRRAVALAFDRGAVVAGGPVLASAWQTRREWACYFSEYGFHAVAPYTSSTGDVSANNVAYSRPALADLDGPLWKSEVNRRLMGRGVRPVLVPDMQVFVTKPYPWEWLLRERIRQGSLYAAQRCRGWSRPRRLAYAVAATLLPFLLFARLTTRVGADRDLRGRFWGSAPLVSVAMMTWSVGEVLGALGWKDRNDQPF